MKLLYLAGPWFTPEQEKEYSKVIDEITRRYDDWEIFIPRYYKVPDGDNLPNWNWGAKVCHHDIKMLNRADLVIAIDWGFNADAGTAFEVGYASAKRKEIILYVPKGVKTVSCMLHGMADLVLDHNFNKMCCDEIEWK